MKKVEKGKPGYLNYKKKAEILRTVIYFAIVAAIFLLGYTQTHTRLNLMTVVAVLGCLPASKALVGVIARFPYPSIDPDRAKEIAKISRHLTATIQLSPAGKRSCRQTALLFPGIIFTAIPTMRK